MEHDKLLSIGVAACEAGCSVSRMERALREVKAVPAVTLNRIPHFREADVDRAIESVRRATREASHAK